MGWIVVNLTHLKRAPSNFFFIPFWNVVRLGSTESATFVACCDLDLPFSLDFVCASVGFFEGFFTSLVFAFPTKSVCGVTIVDLLSATPSEESVNCLPLCLFFGGRFTESTLPRVSTSFSRLTWADSNFSDDASGSCGLFRFLDFFEDDDGVGSVGTDQPGTSKSGGDMSDCALGSFIIPTAAITSSRSHEAFVARKENVDLLSCIPYPLSLSTKQKI